MLKISLIFLLLPLKAWGVVHGNPIKWEKMPSIVKIGDCTAVKISSNQFLTANHCVRSTKYGRMKRYRNGKRLKIFYGDKAEKNILGIIKNIDFPQSLELVRKIKDRHQIIDLALITLRFDLQEKIKNQEIKIANISFDKASSKVTIAGYGSTSLMLFNNDFTLTSGKSSNALYTAIVPFPSYKGYYLHLPGDLNTPKEFHPVAQLGSGDSGGPVYEGDNRTIYSEVIAINSSTNRAKAGSSAVYLGHKEIQTWLVEIVTKN